MKETSTIGELKLMVENLSQNLTNHAVNSSDSFRELKDDMKELKKSLDTKAPLDAFFRLEQRFEVHKETTSKEVNSMAVKVGIGTGIVMAVSALAKFFVH